MGISKTRIRQIRAISGAYGVIEKLLPYSAEDIIINAYIQTEDPLSQQLSKMYEQMLVLAKEKKELYIEQRDSLHMRLAEFVHTNKMYKEFAHFCYLVATHVEVQGIMNAYLSECMDSTNYLSDHEQIFYGVTDSNKPLFCSIYYGDFDLKFLELRDKEMRGIISMKNFISEYNKLDANGEFSLKISNENLLDILMLNCLPFINQRTKMIYPKKWIDHARLTKNELPYRFWKPTEYYKQLLKKRNFIINRKGARLFLKNAGIFTELVIKEDITQNKESIVFFRLVNGNGEGTVCYYIPSEDLFFSTYKMSSDKGLHLMLENILLEVYAELTVGLDKDTKRFYAIKEVEDIDFVENFRPTQLYFQCVLFNENEEGARGGKRKKFTQSPHNRIHTLRKLPANMSASEEAVQRALEYGIDLSKMEGYTFVVDYKVGGTKSIRKEIKEQNTN